MGVNPGYMRQVDSAEEAEAIRVGNLAGFGEERVGLCNRHGVRLVAGAEGPGGDEQIQVVVACSDEQRMLAWQLVGRRYAWRGYACSQALVPFPDRERQAYYTTLLAFRARSLGGQVATAPAAKPAAAK